MDALWQDFDSAGNLVIGVLDAKHVSAADVGRLTEQLVREVVQKRKDLRDRLSRDILAVLVSLAERKAGPDDVSMWLATKEYKDDWTCVISASGDRLKCGLSPVLAYLLMSQRR